MALSGSLFTWTRRQLRPTFMPDQRQPSLFGGVIPRLTLVCIIDSSGTKIKRSASSKDADHKIHRGERVNYFIKELITIDPD